ncbi:hypothetical protein MMC30_006751 [Trapelia coarctata]|nr:hypothetical protein [Trapelia coarctata]
MAEGGLIVIAGNETTGNALNALHFHLLANPEKIARLKAELAEEIKGQWDVSSWQQLKKLPYLTACIEEILRLSSGVPHRLARLAPKGGLRWRDHIIPEGTPVSMANYHMHMNPDIFPRPRDFWPERWPEPEAKSLKKYFAPFSKGPRMCLGIELEYAEMYLATAMIHRRFETELFETVRDDIDMGADLFLAYQKIGSQGLRIKIKQ